MVSRSLRPAGLNNSRLAFLNTQIEKEQTRQNADALAARRKRGRQTQIRASLDQM
jgi:hypothetical protein